MASDIAPGGPPTLDPANLFTAAAPSFSGNVTIATPTETVGLCWCVVLCGLAGPPPVLVRLDRDAKLRPSFE
ncbi:hypothetical protein ACFVW5_06640 [Streptomyces sp. NPDC058232]|uniref:hypothetical protein n=1 Tax=Streptomyces sp. NPDC058232 TaxID=3346393 RepID=UPI0036E2CF41